MNILKLIVIILSFITIGCNKNADEIKIDKAKVIFKETMYHIKNPSFIDEQSIVDGNKVTLMVVYIGTDSQTHSQLIDVYVVEDEIQE